jgi:hypothetical protein
MGEESINGFLGELKVRGIHKNCSFECHSLGASLWPISHISVAYPKEWERVEEAALRKSTE